MSEESKVQSPKSKVFSDEERNYLIWACGFAAGVYLERSKKQDPGAQEREEVIERKLCTVAMKVSQL